MTLSWRKIETALIEAFKSEGFLLGTKPDSGDVLVPFDQFENDFNLTSLAQALAERLS